MDLKKYIPQIQEAIRFFWDTRNNQISTQVANQSHDQGNRGAVTGGKQLDGFIQLLVSVSLEMGIPKGWIYTKNNHIPGYFRPTKDWDFLIITPDKQLVAAIELKSQVGSFGNNFNNRSEEAIGSACDFWTAFRENLYPNQPQPWVGYLMLIEKSDKSTSSVRLSKPHYEPMPEFNDTSYMDRYSILCGKLIAERLYTSTSLIWTQKQNYMWGDVISELSILKFIVNFAMHLQAVVTLRRIP